ncbi:MAG: hypothetical protein DMF12_09750, partial [Verrucomicrobia bacterium]
VLSLLLSKHVRSLATLTTFPFSFAIFIDFYQARFATLGIGPIQSNLVLLPIFPLACANSFSVCSVVGFHVLRLGSFVLLSSTLLEFTEQTIAVP